MSIHEMNANVIRLDPSRARRRHTPDHATAAAHTGAPADSQILDAVAVLIGRRTPPSERSADSEWLDMVAVIARRRATGLTPDEYLERFGGGA